VGRKSCGSDRREFGRRACTIRGMAIVAGRAPIACTLRDLSEGGALLEFEVAFEGARSFRLAIDDTDLEALCESRHVRGQQVGVRFVRQADGHAIYRHFQCAVVMPSEQAPVANKIMPKLDMAELRRDVLHQAKAAKVSRRVGLCIPRANRYRRCTGLVQAAALAIALNSAVLTRKAIDVAEFGAEHQDWQRAA
jgi:PilZ domain